MSDHTSPPRENLIRAVMPGLEFRDAEYELTAASAPVRSCSPRSTSGPRSGRRGRATSWSASRPARTRRRSVSAATDPCRCSSTATTRRSATSRSAEIRDVEEDDQGGYGEVALLDTSYNRAAPVAEGEGLRGVAPLPPLRRARAWDDDPEPSEITIRRACLSARSRSRASPSSGPSPSRLRGRDRRRAVAHRRVPDRAASGATRSRRARCSSAPQPRTSGRRARQGRRSAGPAGRRTLQHRRRACAHLGHRSAA
jgi:hypothetical protein